MPAKRLWFSGAWDPALSCGVLSHHKQGHHAGLKVSMLRYSHSNQDTGAHSEYGSLQLMSHSFLILWSSFLFGFTSPEPTFVIHLSSWQKAETVTQWKIPLRPAAANTTPEAAGFCRPCPIFLVLWYQLSGVWLFAEQYSAWIAQYCASTDDTQKMGF